MQTRQNRGTKFGRCALLVAPLLFALLSIGCTNAYNLYPLHDKTVATTDDNLVGKWDGIDQKNGKEVRICCWTFEKDGDTYKAMVPDPDDKMEFVSTLHLVKLGDAIFVDAAGADLKYTHTTQVGFPQMKAHMFGRIWIDKDTLRFAMLDDVWLKETAKTGSPPLAFLEVDNDIVITATTAQLQAFARQYADDTKVFSDTYDLRRHK